LRFRQPKAAWARCFNPLVDPQIDEPPVEDSDDFVRRRFNPLVDPQIDEPVLHLNT
jgi:hypothetical protein